MVTSGNMRWQYSSPSIFQAVWVEGWWELPGTTEGKLLKAEVLYITVKGKVHLRKGHKVSEGK